MWDSNYHLTDHMLSSIVIILIPILIFRVGQEMDHSLINKLQNGVANGYDEPPKYSVIDAYANEAYEMQGDHLQENGDAPHPSTHTGPQPGRTDI